MGRGTRGETSANQRKGYFLTCRDLKKWGLSLKTLKQKKLDMELPIQKEDNGKCVCVCACMLASEVGLGVYERKSSKGTMSCTLSFHLII